MAGQRGYPEREEWQTLVGEYETGSEGQAAFCERRRLRLGSFRSWLYRLRRERNEGRGIRLVQVDVAEEAVSNAWMEIEVAAVGKLRFLTGTDPRYVASLIAELRRFAC